MWKLGMELGTRVHVYMYSYTVDMYFIAFTVVSWASAHSWDKRPCITFQGATVAASIQTYGILILGKRLWGPRSRVMFKRLPGTLRYVYVRVHVSILVYNIFVVLKFVLLVCMLVWLWLHSILSVSLLSPCVIGFIWFPGVPASCDQAECSWVVDHYYWSPWCSCQWLHLASLCSALRRNLGGLCKTCRWDSW